MSGIRSTGQLEPSMQDAPIKDFPPASLKPDHLEIFVPIDCLTAAPIFFAARLIATAETAQRGE